ncbi:MAG: cytochrome c553 [Pirellulaceae bacterium]|jgi:cytochrome c553
MQSFRLSRMAIIATVVVLATCVVLATSVNAVEPAHGADSFAIPKSLQAVIANRCLECHSDDESEGNARLDALSKMRQDERLTLLNRVQEQLFFGFMPPKDEQQLTAAEHAQLADWVSKELNKHDASKLEEKLRLPAYGNYVDHDKLYSGEYVDAPSFTHNRRWLISEFIFNVKINRLVDYEGIRTIDGQRMSVIGDNGVNLGTRFGGGTLRQSITNPFLLPTNIGVRYYDNTMLTGGHLLTMISNAKKIAGYMSSEQAMKSYYPAMYRIMKMELDHRETLRTREKFLNSYAERVVLDIYKKKNDTLLPEFVRIEVEPIPDYDTDRDGNPIKRTNLELLRTRYGEDVQAVYRGISKYKQVGVTFEQIIEKCEKEWFIFGVHEKRLRARVTLMKVLMKQWDMALIYKDVGKGNIRQAAYQPLPDSEMDIVTASILKHRKKGDRYRQIIDKCMNDWEQSLKAERVAAGQADEGQVVELVDELFAKIYERKPTEQETQENIALTHAYMKTLGNQQAIAKLIETLILSSEMVYRIEFGQGKADEHGRRMMSPRDASYALAYAVTDSSPDEELVAAVNRGKLDTREDYRREVVRMLKRRDQYCVIDETVQKAGFNSSITNTPIRKLRFFREFFGYTKAMTIFKDDARFSNGASYDGVKGRLVDEADMLVDHILQEDRNVFERLLTTETFYVYHSGNNEAMQAASDRIRKIYDYFHAYDWENFTEEELYEHWDFIKEMKMMGTVFPDFETNATRRKNWVRTFKSQLTSYTFRYANGQKAAAPYDATGMAYWNKSDASTRTGQQMRGPDVGRFFGIDFANWDYPTTQPAKIENRKGMLTHPAWLIAHSLNLETDPVRRGKWVREKLLAGTIPDVPITVDAVVPEDHHKTLRQRLEKKTGETYCWNCHKKMNPLGVAFEVYDDFGRYRTQERLEHPDNLIKETPRERGLHIDGRPVYKTLPVNAKGYLDGTGDKALDGEVADVIDLTQRLAKSVRVRQSIVRHAFRYFMGRNEVLSDSKTLIDADQAYVNSGGSFDAVIVSLLTSDSFIYRREK